MKTEPALMQITLYYREGGSDKVYQCSIEQSNWKRVKPDGSESEQMFVVNFAFGRRGAALSTGTKTQAPVSLDEARQIYNKLIREKTAKGYTPGESATPYAQTENAPRATGLAPQLLNPIDESEAECLILDPSWCAQEKFDGKRVMIVRRGGIVSGVNRRCLTIGLPDNIVAAAHVIGGDFVLDGECVGDTFHAFDILEDQGIDLRGQPYSARLEKLALLPMNSPFLTKALTAKSTAEKRSLSKLLHRIKAEGIVFKRLDAPYVPGRPPKGGPQLKHKFYASCSAVVESVNEQRSVNLQLLKGKDWVAAGSVTIPPNHKVPAPGSIVEVRYLYAFPESGALFQPVYLGVRDDVNKSACRVSQLKFKSQTTASAN